MSEKRNIRDHKRRAKYELRRKLYKDFCKFISGGQTSLVVVQVAKKNSFARVRNRCISTGLPRSVYEFIGSFSHHQQTIGYCGKSSSGGAFQSVVWGAFTDLSLDIIGSASRRNGSPKSSLGPISFRALLNGKGFLPKEPRGRWVEFSLWEAALLGCDPFSIFC